MGPEAQFEEFDREGQWPYVFHRIKEESRINNFTLNSAKRPDYRSRNRYRDVSPYDHSRVVLQRGDIDYINASYVESSEANRRYILTQGPLPDTAAHFWLMVWENDSRAILMLNRVIEKGVIKCHQYYPTGEIDEEDEVDEFLDFPEVQLQVQFLSEQDCSYYTVRTLQLTDLQSGSSRNILQFHYTTWPDFGVPETPQAFLDFLFAVRNAGVLEQDVGPPIIHCSAGIGRSGTFCLVDTCLILIEKKQDPNCVEILQLLLQLRQYRMGLIQTPDQLRFSYLAVIEGARRVLNLDTPLITSGESAPDSNKRRAMFQNGPHRHSSMEEDVEDVPKEPPPPPPRVYPGHRTTTTDENDNSNNGDIEPTSQSSANHVPSSQTELRRRNREERIAKTAAQIEKMKEKQRNSEKWKGRRSQAFTPMVIGLSLAALIGSYLVYRYYYGSVDSASS